MDISATYAADPSLKRSDSPSSVATSTIPIPEDPLQLYELSTTLRNRALKLLSSDIPGALAIARTIPNLFTQSSALKDVSYALTRVLDFSGAITVANMITGDPADKRNALLNVAMTLATHGRTDEALEIAASIPTSYERAQALHFVSKAFAGKHNYDKALEVALKINDTPLQGSSLQTICMGLNRSGQQERALEVSDMIRDFDLQSETKLGLQLGYIPRR